MIDPYDRAAEWIAESERVVAFSGAGVSAESGIATFRDPGGIWERFDPEEVGTVPGIVELVRTDPERLAGFFRESLDSVLHAKPNAGHRALARLESAGRLAGVITQNVDNLHQEAGSTRVIELHGNVRQLRCTSCGTTELLTRANIAQCVERVFSGDLAFGSILSRLPRCAPCGELQRIDVVLFGEAVQRIDEAHALAENADLMLVIGTSGMVYPAADLPAACRRRGGRVIVINPHENNFAGLGGVYLQESSGVALDELARRVTA